ncbi:hypothetical protein M9H77_06572 [Catharanthus roseus]|uniref:Uncharacterized protein n=1 Tax=Catharanthus roseus TaxID=4058 RepID=A0ACC0BSG9_CATRO|nr:hypothetical protein M9H77_06572 [Catharanthus roseus]
MVLPGGTPREPDLGLRRKSFGSNSLVYNLFSARQFGISSRRLVVVPGDLIATMSEIELKTAPADFRFPTTNQTRHCFTRYIEFHRCLAAKGEESGECERFAKYYRSLCPGEWRHTKRRNLGVIPGKHKASHPMC